MAEAKGSLSLDTSKFESGINSAKSQLSSLSSIVQGVGSAVSKGLSAWDGLQSIASRINNFQNDVTNLTEAYKKLKNISGPLNSAFEKFKSTIATTGGFLANNISTIDKLGKKFVSLASSLAIVYIYYKTFSTIIVFLVSTMLLSYLLLYKLPWLYLIDWHLVHIVHQYDLDLHNAWPVT
jgi:predicted PurR-regulated permease PerM